MNETKLTAPADRPVILIERWFDAARRLVWKATTTPELVRRWWAPSWTEMVTCEMDVRVGGAWRFVLRAPHGDVGFHGEYREVAAPSRIVRTSIYEPYPDAGAIETSALIEAGERTQLVLEAAYPTLAVRDAVVASGMERGVRDSHAQLEALARSLA